MQQEKETTKPKGVTDEMRQQAEQRAEAIREKEGLVKVYPLIFWNPEADEPVYCFLKEPDYQAKLAILDRVSTHGVYSAGEYMRQLCTIADHSDAITYGEAPQSDPYKLGVVAFIRDNLVTVYTDQYKKK